MLKIQETKLYKDLVNSKGNIVETRAMHAVEDMIDAQEKIIREIKDREKAAVRGLRDLKDIYKDSSFSLKVVKDNFDAESHMRDIQVKTVNLDVIRVELKAAHATNKEWFGIETETDSNAE